MGSLQGQGSHGQTLKNTIEEIEQHPNPDVHIKVLDNFGVVSIGEKFMHIKESFEQNKKFSTIFGNPNPNSHMPLAELINVLSHPGSV